MLTCVVLFLSLCRFRCDHRSNQLLLLNFQADAIGMDVKRWQDCYERFRLDATYTNATRVREIEVHNSLIRSRWDRMSVKSNLKQEFHCIKLYHTRMAYVSVEYSFLLLSRYIATIKRSDCRTVAVTVKTTRTHSTQMKLTIIFQNKIINKFFSLVSLLVISAILRPKSRTPKVREDTQLFNHKNRFRCGDSKKKLTTTKP